MRDELCNSQEMHLFRSTGRIVRRTFQLRFCTRSKIMSISCHLTLWLFFASVEVTLQTIITSRVRHTVTNGTLNAGKTINL
jgi:hypothetical protein